MVEQPSENQGSHTPPQGEGGERRRGSHLWRAAVTFGDEWGANGIRARVFWWGLAGLAVLVCAFNTVNVLTDWHDNPDWGLIGPVVGEATSAISLVAAGFLPYLALRATASNGRPLWRSAGLHIPAVVLFSFIHVAGFVALRKIVYALAGEHYGSAPLTQNFFYEFRKDMLAYVLAVATFWIVARLLTPQVFASAAPLASAQTFDIRDGAKLTRVKLADILAVTSAGNYVEFVLADGRKLLMRSPLSTLETELAPHCFVRTHRSWLVNAAAVTALKPQGSGDYAVSLGSLEVPLSRRFPDALARLRAG